MQKSKNILAVIINIDSISMVYKGAPKTVNRDHPCFNEIKEKLQKGDHTGIETLIDTKKVINRKLEQAQKHGSGISMCLDTERVFWNGNVLHNALTEKLLEDALNGHDVSAFANFVDNLMQNPSARSVNELYGFMQKGNMPITADGHFLAYKKVRANYKDCHSGTCDNSVGQVLEMPRNQVDDNRERTCSFGYHFCSFGYLNHFWGDRVMIVKINPKDVVSIPADYNDTKGRTCRYEVIGEVEDWQEKLQEDIFANKSGSDWDDTEVDYDDDEDSWDDDLGDLDLIDEDEYDDDYGEDEGDDPQYDPIELWGYTN